MKGFIGALGIPLSTIILAIFDPGVSPLSAILYILAVSAFSGLIIAGFNDQ